ncbi:hypothetical protein [Thermoflexus sp.]|uniref:hypothetical protein n=1 Tax=Thermoflexus sp. TaxID=1969742 RepID=UPI002ADE3A32|nr:hypothetical protein [Thermoflexus sp.]
MNAPFRFGPHVMEARASHQPIVALETVVVAFGLPRRIARRRSDRRMPICSPTGRSARGC